MSQRSPEHPRSQLRRAVGDFYAMLASMAVLGLAPLGAVRLIAHGTGLSRAAAVAVGVLGAVPWMVITGRIIRRGDEFNRQVHLVALAWAFGGAMLLIVTLAWLERARFIAPPNLFVLWLGLLIIWWIAMFVARRRFEQTA